MRDNGALLALAACNCDPLPTLPPSPFSNLLQCYGLSNVILLFRVPTFIIRCGKEDGMNLGRDFKSS